MDNSSTNVDGNFMGCLLQSRVPTVNRREGEIIPLERRKGKGEREKGKGKRGKGK
jgi:hypothetical protein